MFIIAQAALIIVVYIYTILWNVYGRPGGNALNITTRHICHIFKLMALFKI
jgi:hypothetical protein